MQATCLEIYGFTIIMSDIGLYAHINVVVPRVTICLNQKKYGKNIKIRSYTKKSSAACYLGCKIFNCALFLGEKRFQVLF